MPAIVELLANAADPAQVGGKAASLGELLRAGFPVPEGFVVTTHAFRIARGVADVPRDVQEHVLRAYHELFAGGSGRVAVRSSATAEDLPDASMAGQYDTFLDVAGADALLAALRACWASVDSPRLRAYLQQTGRTHDRIAMAVVVQKLIPADISGVMFTVNPHTGSRDELLIEAAWGLGETLVSGRVQPDVLRVRLTDGVVLEETVADKAVMLRAGSRAEQAVPAGLRKTLCLADAHVQQLRDLARRAAAHFQAPQDIEWAIAEGKLYQLQSRPITTLAALDAYHAVLASTRETLQARAAAGRGPWVLHNLAETLPHPTPLTWSIMQPFMTGRGGFGAMYRRAGFSPTPVAERGGFLELIAGRVYMDAARAPEMFFANYPFRYDAALLRRNPQAAQAPPTIPAGGILQRFRGVRRIGRINRQLDRLSATQADGLAQQTIPEFVAWCGEQARLELPALSAAELTALWHQRRQRVLDDFAPACLLPSLIAGRLVAQLQTFLAEHFWHDDPAELAGLLSSSLTPDLTVASNIDLHRLARGALALPEWLARYGHRAPNELDLSSPRWREQPEAVTRLAARLAGAPDPAQHHREHVAAVENKQRWLSSQLRVDARATFAALLDRTRRYMAFREDSKHYLMLGFALLRGTALEVGRRTGLGDDVFYLTELEMLAALSGPVEGALLNARKERHAAESRVLLKHFIDANSIAQIGTPEAHGTAGAGRFPAFALSTGAAQGPVRILCDPAEARDLGADYILVCRSTDPAWTPLLLGAAGVILECGGTLSHGAVVAREMGIPAVVLPDALSLLQEGETVTVDGHSGAVIRNVSDAPLISDAVVEYLAAPPPGRRERQAATLRRVALIGWLAYLAAAFVLPEAWLYQPSLGALDVLLWPLVRGLGKPGAVAVIGAASAAVILLLQFVLTDTPRLREAKARGGPGVPARLFGAAMVPLAVLLGPLVMLFFWLPARVDPASASPPPGSDVTVVAKVDSDFRGPVLLAAAEPLTLDESTPAAQQLAPIREALTPLLSDPTALAALKRPNIEADLRRYLQHLPAQALMWRLRSSPTADGRFAVTLAAGQASVQLPIVLGARAAPAVRDVTLGSNILRAATIVYPKPPPGTPFFSPLARLGYPGLDIGWLGVYLLTYLPTMLLLRRILRLP